MKPARTLLALSILAATSFAVAGATGTGVPRTVIVPAEIPAPAEAPPTMTVQPPRVGIAETLAIDPQIADLRRELAQLRRESAAQAREIAALKSCAAALAAEARSPGLSGRMTALTPAKALTPDTATMSQSTLTPVVTTQAVTQSAPRRFPDCG